MREREGKRERGREGERLREGKTHESLREKETDHCVSVFVYCGDDAGRPRESQPGRRVKELIMVTFSFSVSLAALLVYMNRQRLRNFP